MKYKTFQVKGTPRYMLDGKLISKDKVPPHVLKNLQANPLFDTDQPEPVVDKKCIFCGKETNLYRWLNLRTMYICQEHLDNKTTGQVVQQYNKLNGVKDEEREVPDALQPTNVQENNERSQKDA